MTVKPESERAKAALGQEAGSGHTYHGPSLLPHLVLSQFLSP